MYSSVVCDTLHLQESADAAFSCKPVRPVTGDGQRVIHETTSKHRDPEKWNHKSRTIFLTSTKNDKMLLLRHLRSGYGGQMRMNPVFAELGLKEMLPLKLDVPDEGCTRNNRSQFCFDAGLFFFCFFFFFK